MTEQQATVAGQSNLMMDGQNFVLPAYIGATEGK